MTALTVADRVAIEQLFARYAWSLDTADLEGIVSVFTPDAVIEDPFGRYQGRGPDGLPLFFARIIARPDFAGRQHWLGQARIEGDRENCIVHSYAMIPAAYPSGAVHLHILAYYRDELALVDGEWLFRSRIVGPTISDGQPAAR